jgi:Flp pilus assembly protein TadG
MTMAQRPEPIAVRILRDRKGATIIEFAIVAPVMIMMIMGFGDLLQRACAQAILDGAMQKAGRDSAIQGGANAAAAIDATVKDAVDVVTHNATYVTTRRAYTNFTAVRPEVFTDADNDNVHDPSECFFDVNSNRQWDEDPGSLGQGGADDATLYTMTVTYDRIFPIAGFIGGAPTTSLTSRTVLKNQPFATQNAAVVTRVCP